MHDYDVAIIGSGFVGSSLAHFLNNSFSVKTFDVLPQSSILLNSNIPHELIDITDSDSLKKIGNPKIVIHSAIIQIPKINEDKNLGYNVNVKGTQNICELVDSNNSIKGISDLNIIDIINVDKLGYRIKLISESYINDPVNTSYLFRLSTYVSCSTW